jgi:hypothetical protein
MTLNLSFSTGIGWNHQSQEFILGHALNLHQKWSSKTVINYSGSTQTTLKAMSYKTFSCSVSITQQLYRNWFYGTIALGSTFTRDYVYFSSNNYLYISTSALF